MNNVLDFDVICCPVGTGGTLAGIAAGLSPGRRALGFAALKGGQFLDDDVAELQRRQCGAVGTNWSIDHDFHFGGFARATPELHDFIDDFERRHSLRLDWIYVAKMMYGLFSLVEQGVLRPETVVVAVITGPADQK